MLATGYCTLDLYQILFVSSIGITFSVALYSYLSYICGYFNMEYLRILVQVIFSYTAVNKVHNIY